MVNLLSSPSQNNGKGIETSDKSSANHVTPVKMIYVTKVDSYKEEEEDYDPGWDLDDLKSTYHKIVT